MLLRDLYSDVVLSSQKETTGSKMLKLSLESISSGWKLLHLSWSSSRPSFSPFDFCDRERALLPSWANDMGSALWLDLVPLFTATECIYLTKRYAVRVGPALQELAGAGATQILSVLRNIFVERLDSLGPVQEAIGQFVATRQLLSSHPIDVQCWVEGEPERESIAQGADDGL